MLTVLRNDDKSIKIACEWWLVDQTGNRNHQGIYVFVEHIEGTPNCTSTDLRELIHLIAICVPEAVGAYWVRERHTGKKPHGYRRDQLLKQGVMVG